jgi:ABC-2 type transport system ATP-binding protein
MSDKIVLNLIYVSIKVGGNFLIKNLNMKINRGDRVLFKAPNGSGKSLLFNVISRGLTESIHSKYKGLEITGEIILFGHNILTNNNYNSDKILFMSQEDDFHYGYTVLEEISSSLNARGLEYSEDKIAKILNEFGLYSRRNKKIHKGFSSGELKIIHFIKKILVFKYVDFILFDEPLNHISSENSLIMNNFLSEAMKESDKTFFMISHCDSFDIIDKEYRYDNRKHILKEYTL